MEFRVDKNKICRCKIEIAMKKQLPKYLKDEVIIEIQYPPPFTVWNSDHLLPMILNVLDGYLIHSTTKGVKAVIIRYLERGEDVVINVMECAK